MSLFDDKLLDWQTATVPEGNVYPVAREGQGTALGPNSTELLMFGGLSHTCLNDLHSYHFSQKRWKQLQAKGKSPSARAFHCVFIAESRFFVFGGQNDRGKSLGDLHVLLLEGSQWKKLFIMDGPCARHQAAVCLYSTSGLTRRSRLRSFTRAERK